MGCLWSAFEERPYARVNSNGDRNVNQSKKQESSEQSTKRNPQSAYAPQNPQRSAPPIPIPTYAAAVRRVEEIPQTRNIELPRMVVWQPTKESRIEEQRRAERVKADQRKAEEKTQKAALKAQRLREEQEQQDLNEFVCDIQAHIRTQRSFDCSTPQKYKHSLNTLNSRDFKDTLRSLRTTYPNKYPDTVVKCIVAWAAEGKYFVTHNNHRSVSVKDLTPYQGNNERRVFGEYSCNCGRSWSSAGSWKDKFQKCKSCECAVYPYRQSQLQQADHTNDDESERRPHDCARCQKCSELGELCLPLYYYAV